MKHTLSADGYCYKLRPVTIEDAEFIINLRMNDTDRTKFIHPIPLDIDAEKNWLNRYFQRDNDYFFIIEDKMEQRPVGTIAIYDIEEERGEWGRWVIEKGSMASAESVYLLYQIAFSKLHLEELFCRTVENNVAVTAFHSSSGLATRAVLQNFFCLNGVSYNAVEQYVTKENFISTVSCKLEQHVRMIFQRMLRSHVGKFEFHHIGIACTDIVREEMAYHMLGYHFELDTFTDENQGIMGKFGEANGQPRIELLANLEGQHTLTPYLQKGIKMYHYAYCVSDIEKAGKFLEKNRAKVMSPLKKSAYFEKRICFYMLPNMLLVELVEE